MRSVKLMGIVKGKVAREFFEQIPAEPQPVYSYEAGDVGDYYSTSTSLKRMEEYLYFLQRERFVGGGRKSILVVAIFSNHFDGYLHATLDQHFDEIEFEPLRELVKRKQISILDKDEQYARRDGYLDAYIFFRHLLSNPSPEGWREEYRKALAE